MIRGPQSYSPEWFALRKYDAERKERPVVIGASEAAVVCGQSQFKQPLRLYYEKKGILEPEAQSDAARRGVNIEPIILDEYEHVTKVKIDRDIPMLFPDNPELWYVAATPDAISQKTSRHPLDAKCSTYQREWGEEGTDEMPVEYIMQGQMQLFVCGADLCEFPVMFPSRYGWDFRVFEVRRHNELIQHILKAQQEFVERLINDDPPDAHWEMAEDSRRVFESAYRDVDLVAKNLSDAAVAWWSDYQRLGLQIKSLEDERKRSLAHFVEELGGASIGLLPRGEKEVSVSKVAESVYIQADVDKIQAKVGQVKLKGYITYRERKRTIKELET